MVLCGIEPVRTSDYSVTGANTDQVATFLRISGSKGVISNARHMFEPSATSTEYQKRFGDRWRARAGFNDVRVESVDVSVTILDEVGQRYLDDVNHGGSQHMTRQELIANHGRSFASTIKFPTY